jgi:hypothetical protein
MVAITVLVAAVAAPLTLAAQSLFASYYAKDQTTAFYLAQEAIEVVRNQRDSNLLAYLNGENVGWLDSISTDTAFHVDVQNEPHMIECSASCLDEKLLHNGVFYNHQSGDTSRFSREVLITPNPTFPNEAIISATVRWQTGSFRVQEIALEERIYNWIPE